MNQVKEYYMVTYKQVRKYGETEQAVYIADTEEDAIAVVDSICSMSAKNIMIIHHTYGTRDVDFRGCPWIFAGQTQWGENIYYMTLGDN